MKVGYIQFAPAIGDADGNRRRMERLLGGVEADLVVLPELANSGYNFARMEQMLAAAESADDGLTIALWRRVAAQRDMTIVGGFAEKDGARCFNAAAAVTPDGAVRVYRKIHLFGEEARWFAPGEAPPAALDVPGARIGVMICFDWAFPETARVLALAAAEIICHPANIVTGFPPQALVVRGVENRVFTVTANRTGVEDGAAGRLRFRGLSQVTTPDGEVLARAGEDDEEARAVEIDPARARDKRLAGITDMFALRRPELYGAITAPPPKERR